MNQLVLSLFPGIGLLDMAFEEEGFCVVRGPDLLWGGDIRRWHVPRGRFDGIIGGPPCQIFSRMRFLNPLAGQKHGNLIPEFARCVREAQPDWFVMENVSGAPSPDCGELYTTKRIRVTDVAVGGATSRDRAFTFGAMGGQGAFYVDELALHNPEPRQAVLAGGSGRAVPVALGGSGKVKRTLHPRHGPNPGPRATIAEMLEAQGAPDNWLEESPFTNKAKCHMLGNGVPLATGRAVARAVKRALGIELEVVAGCAPRPT